jgi:hypothetical protein
VKPAVSSVVSSVVGSVPLYETQAPAGPEDFITNGGFTDSSNWTAGTGWDVSNGNAAYSSGGMGVLSQEFGSLVGALENGADYTVTFDLVNNNGGQVVVILSGPIGFQIVYSSTSSGVGRTANFTATNDRTTISFQSVDDEPLEIDNLSLVPA